MEHYKLDPASDLTSPGLAWDAMLLQTKVELELINDVDMLSIMGKQKKKRTLLCRLQATCEGKQQIHSGLQPRGKLELPDVVGR